MDNKNLLLDLTEEQAKQFETYFNFLIEQNKLINLTAITEEQEVYIKHFYDSLLVNEIIDISNIKSICDIGSGAGFPSIPLKIMFPSIHVTIIEPIKKRTNFLERLVELLEIYNVSIVNGRAEVEIESRREKYDVVVARAVAKLDVLSELCLPFVKVGGHFIAMKGRNYQGELLEATRAIKTLGGKVENDFIYSLPEEMGNRTLIKILKEKPTNPRYPRHFSKIKKNPL